MLPVEERVEYPLVLLPEHPVTRTSSSGVMDGDKVRSRLSNVIDNEMKL